MKKLYYAIALLLILCMVVTGALLVLSPDIIPAHYNASGEVDRFGSKYEQLIFPGFAVVMAAVMLGLQRFGKRRGMAEFEQKVLLYTAIFSIVLFIALELFFGILVLKHDGGAALPPEGIVKLVSIFTGVMLLVLGNLMPKARRNSYFGLRTRWSMSSDRAWQKSQRFGGISGGVCGLAMVVLSVILPGLGSIWALTGLMLAWVTAGIGASYWYWKQEGQ